MNPDADREDRLYQEIRDIDQFYKVVNIGMKEYNNTNKNRMDLVIFRSLRTKLYFSLLSYHARSLANASLMHFLNRYLLEHLSKICRILRSPGGHGLLVG